MENRRLPCVRINMAAAAQRQYVADMALAAEYERKDMERRREREYPNWQSLIQQTKQRMENANERRKEKQELEELRETLDRERLERAEEKAALLEENSVLRRKIEEMEEQRKAELDRLKSRLDKERAKREEEFSREKIEWRHVLDSRAISLRYVEHQHNVEIARLKGQMSEMKRTISSFIRVKEMNKREELVEDETIVTVEEEKNTKEKEEKSKEKKKRRFWKLW